jgi:hypothetical protein
MPNQIDATALAGSVGAQDLSIWSLFLNADWIVKLVILLLVVASFWTLWSSPSSSATCSADRRRACSSTRWRSSASRPMHRI